MSSSTGRNHTALLAAGIFAHESGQRLLSILLMLADRGFKGLYDKCARNLDGHYYQEGLRRVHKWSDDVVREDIAFVREACPDLDETYAACFVQYVSDRWRDGRPTVRTPDLLAFVRRFLEALGQQESLVTGDFFARRDDPVYRRVTCMDAARTALYALVTAESVRVELLSEVAAPSSKPLAEATRAELGGADEEEAAPADEEEEGEMVEVHPADSVSQVGAARAASVASRAREAPRAASVVSAAREAAPPPRAASVVAAAREAPRAASVVSAAREAPRAASVVSAAAREPAAASVAEPPPLRRSVGVGGSADSTVSRHDHIEEAAAEEDEGARAPPRRRLMPSSRESNVSVGLPNRRSPKH
jgi:hypothetical protein